MHSSENDKININYVNLNYSNPSNLENLFQLKAEKMKNSDLKIDNETKLKFYGLFKVATVGKMNDSNKTNVGMFDFTGKYKK
jgi:acyl-CoA-binding protein